MNLIARLIHASCVRHWGKGYEAACLRGEGIMQDIVTAEWEGDKKEAQVKADKLSGVDSST